MKNHFASYKASEIMFVRENISRLSDSQLADHLGRTHDAIKGLRHRFQISRNNDGRFQKGHKPFNKGKHFDPGGRSPETRFKKGNVPHNTKHDFCIVTRIDTKTRREYQFIRIESKWVALQRYVWELAHGSIPKGFICAFRDGNTQNCSLENLELITRQENAIRNHNSKKAAVTMKKHWNYCRRKEHAGIKTTRHKQLVKNGTIK